MPDIARSRDGVIRADGSLDLTLGDLTFIRIDYQARLQLGTFEIVIETPFTLRADGIEYALDPEDRGGLGPLLALYPDELTMASVDSDGALQLMFGHGATVTVPPDPRYEAWQINGPGTSLVVCLPGTEGELAAWEVREDCQHLFYSYRNTILMAIYKSYFEFFDERRLLTNLAPPIDGFWRGDRRHCVPLGACFRRFERHCAAEGAAGDTNGTR